jgi:molybdopterin molybdotransferase
VYDANAHVVAALARRAGARVLGAERARDDPAQLRAALGRCLQADVAVVCGGLSVGAHDHVREGLAALGVQERFAGVALKPGRPAWFGTFAGTGQGGRRRRTLVFGLPGNPLSSLAAFVLLAAPALRTLAGLRPPTRGASAALSEPYEKPAGRTHAVPCRLRHDGERLLAQPAWVPGSHVLSSALGADALAIVPATCERVSAGERVRVELVDR